MKYNLEKHRRSTRLKGYDYTQPGAYFVTICTQNKECLFGEVTAEQMRLNETGVIIQEEWLRTATMRQNVQLDVFAIMPNHIHGIVVICDAFGRGTLQRAPTVEQFGKPTSNSIPTITRLFKAGTTKRLNTLRNTPGMPVWQRNYYEHVIRSEESLNRIRQYIIDNPAQWLLDRENPNAASREQEDAWLL